MSSDSSLNAILKSFGYDSIEEFDREDAAKLAATGCSSWTAVNKRNDEIALDATGCSSWTEVNAAKKCRGLTKFIKEQYPDTPF